MYTPLDTIILDKPIEEATYLDWCKGTPRQRLLKEMKDAPREVVKARTGELAEMAFEAMKTCKEGYSGSSVNGHPRTNRTRVGPMSSPPGCRFILTSLKSGITLLTSRR